MNTVSQLLKPTKGAAKPGAAALVPLTARDDYRAVVDRINELAARRDELQARITEIARQLFRPEDAPTNAGFFERAMAALTGSTAAGADALRGAHMQLRKQVEDLDA
ncbi:MAG: hypothetical protein KGL43_00240, partial [Burkholderiales bacterium]|nr:hypothetical protein [Burkholderiales bacterium]